MVQIIVHAVLMALLLVARAGATAAPRAVTAPGEASTTPPLASAGKAPGSGLSELGACTGDLPTGAEAMLTDPAQMHYESQTMQLWASRVYPGIIDVFYKSPQMGDWIQFNNVVPVSQVQGATPGEWGNAEINQSRIQTRRLSDCNGVQQIELQFSPFPDGVHFSVIATLTEGAGWIGFRVVPAADSAPIARFAFGEYFGLADHIRFLEDSGRVYDSTRDWPAPRDGYFRPGYFTSAPLPRSGRVRLWGRSGVVQFQEVTGVFVRGDELDLEIRRTPWRPEFDMPDSPYRAPGFAWLEMVQMVKQDFLSAEWRVGIERVPAR